ncbi:Dihydroorotate dehydrogenase (quinone), mitochondrial, partial [Coemansia sp. RSA 2424]
MIRIAKTSARAFGTKAQQLQQPSRLRNAVWATSGLVIGGLGYLYVTDASAGIHKYISTPLMRQLDAEQAHQMAINAMKHSVCPVDRKADDSVLEIELWGKTVTNPIGVAAGFDKNGEAIDALFGLGFGTVEIGSITPEAQQGNPRPRIFRVEENDAVINRMGLPNCGAATAGERLRSRFWRLLAS